MRELPWKPTTAKETLAALVPAKTLAEAAKALTRAGSIDLALGTTGRGRGDGLLGLVGPDLATTTRLLDGGFPKFRALFPTEFTAVATVPTAALASAVKRVAVVAAANSPVRLTLTRTGLTVEAGSGEDAQALDMIDTDLEGDDITIAFNPPTSSTDSAPTAPPSPSSPSPPRESPPSSRARPTPPPSRTTRTSTCSCRCASAEPAAGRALPELRPLPFPTARSEPTRPHVDRLADYAVITPPHRHQDKDSGMTLPSFLTIVTRQHRERLERAAGVAAVNLRCTALTWQLLRSRGYDKYSDISFPALADETTSDSMLKVTLTGPQLSQLLQQLMKGTVPLMALTAGHRALYQRAYDAVASVVDQIDLSAQDGKPVPDIVIDARITSS